MKVDVGYDAVLSALVIGLIAENETEATTLGMLSDRDELTAQTEVMSVTGDSRRVNVRIGNL